MHFADLLDVRANANPTGSALADEHNGVLSNADVLARIDATAARLSDAGVRRGDVVAVKLPNRIELVTTVFAAWKLGAAVTPVNPSLTPNEVAFQLTDSAARMVVTDTAEQHDRIAVLTLADLAVADPPAVLPDVPRPAEAVALLVYTSGTTGRPKGVELTHTNLMAMAQGINEAMNSGPDTHSLLILPLFHVNGIVVSVLAPLLAGGQTTITGRFDPRRFFDLVAQHRPTFFSAVPTIYSMLAALPAEVAPDTSSLRFAICGAAPMPPQLIEAFEDRYGVPIIEGYGLSEGTCASTTNPLNGIRKPGTVGLALPGQQIAILDGQRVPVAAGTPGEVAIAGPTVMRGYLNRPQETAETIVDGWLHTGDIGFLDADGYLTLVDRAKDMIIRGGENIYPKEIESVLYTHPGVREAAVVGRPDPVYGQMPVAFVTSRSESNLSADVLVAHLAQSLAKYKRPEVIVADEIPKNPVGKIDKPALRRRFTSPSTAV
ncbi:AMP-binding protein [Mycolicibacterium neoaurum]|uniref:class I adenylate-forming enzyme family protein n=1 Tax=Mycolicibacterium neoaurum TaxID=1795 RepID=UPI0026732FAD|nr:AMP-binding protein [Mycolicibacterium neoaurum]MDO3401713.1 AMP-binding protein [Mycolicibacterium neoaurum]